MMPNQRKKKRTPGSRIARRVVIVGCVVTAIGLLGLALHLVNTAQKNRMLTAAMEDGMAAYERGEYAEAIEHLGYYQSRQSENPDVMRMLAGAHAGNPAASRADLMAAAGLARQAWELDPSQYEAAKLELSLRSKLGQYTERLDVARRMLAQRPEDENAQRAEVESLALLGRRDEALETAFGIAENRPDDIEAHQMVLRLLSGLEASESRARMREYGERLAEEHAGEPRFTILAAQALAQAGSMQTATDIAERLLTQADRIDAGTVGDSVRLLDAMALRDRAGELIDLLSDRDDLSGPLAVIRIQRLFKAGRVETARREAEQAVEREPDPSADLVVWANVAGVRVPLADASDVDGYHRAILAGFAALEDNDPATAAAKFRDAVELRPGDALALAGLADASDQLGAWVDAERSRTLALREAPEFSAVRLAQVDALLARDHPERALQAALTGLRIDPSNGGLMLAYVMAVTEMAENDRARTDEIRTAVEVAEQLDAADENGPGVTPATPLLARLMIVRGRLNSAEAIIDRILATQSGTLNPHHLMALANAAERAGLVQTSALVDHVDSDPRLDPSFVLDRAIRLANQGDSDAALDIFSAAMASVDRDSARGRSLHLAWVALLDRIADPRTMSELRRLVDTQTDDAVAQTLVLESAAAWTDEQIVSAAIRHLRRLAGDDSAAWRIHEARRLLVFGRSDADAANAVVLLEPLTETGASDPVAHLVLADALRLLGDTQAAVRHLETAADAGLSRPSVHLRLIDLLRSVGDIETARRRARILAQMEPIDDSTRRERAIVLLGLGLAETAIDDAALLEQSGNPRDLVLAARIAAMAGQEQVLSDRLDRLVDRRDLEGVTLSAACEMLVRAGRTQDAFVTLEANRPPQADPAFLRAEAAVLFASGQSKTAVERLEDAYSLSGDATDVVTLVRALSASNRTDDAKRIVAEAANRHSDSDELALLTKAIEAGDAAIASSQGTRAPVERTISALRSFVLESQDTEALLAELRSITTTYPTYYPGWAILSNTLVRSGRLEEAAESALTASRLMPADTRPARRAVEIMVRLQPLTRALTAAREWQRRARPDTYEPDTTIAAVLMRLGRYDEAAGLLDQWSDRITGDLETPPILIRLLAARLASSGRPADARALFERRSGTDARWHEHEVEVARELVHYVDDPNAARSWLNTLPEGVADDAGLALRIAQGRVDVAARTARRDDAQAAIDAAVHAVSLATPVTREAASLLRVESIRISGDLDRARAENEQLVADSPRRPSPLALLAHIIADQAVASRTEIEASDRRAALQHAERAMDLLEAQPVSAVERMLALEALGRAYLLTGSPEQAEKTFRRILVIDSDHVGARLGMAEAFRDLDRTSQARRIVMDPRLRRALDRYPLLAPRLDRILESLTIAIGGS